MNSLTLTVCLLARNEEQNIGRALASVKPVADEILVVDTGSTDRTVDIALEFGARVIQHPWNEDFAEARNVGLEQATGSWVLMLDADEVVSAKMARELPHVLESHTVDGYMQPVVDCRNGRTFGSTPVVRLFRNRPSYRYVGRIHEQIDSSILAAGGVLEPLRLAIEHYGYTPEEDRRKDRRTRNIRLLQRTLDEDPEDTSAWFFLGMEYLVLSEFGQATGCFRRALALGGSNTAHVSLAAHRLIQIELKRLRVEDGFVLARHSYSSHTLRWDSALLTAQVALLEGEHDLVLQEVRTLRKAPSDDFGVLERNPALLTDLEASAFWLRGDRRQALSLWKQAVSFHPDSLDLATHWVQHEVNAKGLGTGLTSAMRSIHTPQVASACVGALLRAGEFDEAGELASESLDWGFTSFPLLCGLTYSGHWEQADQLAETSGLDGALHLATAAAWFGRDEMLSQALNRITGSWRTGFEQILSAQKMPEELLWVADILMVLWAESGCLPLLEAAGRCLPGDPAAGVARTAWLAHRAGMTAQALEIALRVPDQPDALEVLGLTAFEHDDLDAAAHFLTQRVAFGPAAVQVYHKAARALTVTGNAALARQVLDVGLTQRPQSLLLRQELAGLGRRR